MRSPLLLLLMALGGLAAFVVWLRSPGRDRGPTVTGADGREYMLLKRAVLNADGTGSPSVWTTAPSDGREYFPDLGYDLGTSGQPPIMRSFGA